MDKTLITIVKDQLYIVGETDTGFSYAPCEYDYIEHEAKYDPRLTVKIITTQCLIPLKYHEEEIQKLISLHQSWLVLGGISRENYYSTN